VLLFRFSALTANAHRIHYDRPYATGEEHYPELVVHGPLLAVLMAELPRTHAPERRLSSLTYRFRRPVFAGEPVLVTGEPEGGGARLAVVDAAGTVRAEARAEFEKDGRKDGSEDGSWTS
jgi:hydroxyacyl-ACP dehydratase HTD2-like protein with hotdog domain